MENDELLHKWVNGTLTAQELKIFQQRPEYEELRAVYAATEDLAAPPADTDGMLRDILTQRKKPQPVPVQTVRRTLIPTWLRYGVAASVLLAMLWWMWPQSAPVTYTAAAGKTVTGTLPDGSEFVLNAASSLTYNANTWAEERRLQLQGEAFFRVEEGEKFTVATERGFVTVLGTEFNVRAREYLEVICYSGKVGVRGSAPTAADFGTLQRNEALRTDGTKILQQRILQNKETADWRQGIFRFRDATLADVLAELERQFDVTIRPRAADTRQVITVNFQNRDLKTALKTTLQPLNIRYDFSPEGEVILLPPQE